LTSRDTLIPPGGGHLQPGTATRALAHPPRQICAKRVMKARRSSYCCLCGSLVLTGQRIGQIDVGDACGGWAHIGCIGANRKAA
jgi:hypothetical protein